MTLCLPASLQPLLAGRVPELITHGLAETAAEQGAEGRTGFIVELATHDADGGLGEALEAALFETAGEA